MGLLQQEITIKDLVSQLMTKQMRFAKMKQFNYQSQDPGLLYHSLFNEYGVDLVLQGHVHNYQRTYPYPLIYNSENPSNPTITQSAILSNGDNEENIYVNPEGTIFGIVGTGGRKLHGLDNQAYFTANQLEEHGFLELKTTNNRKSLVGQIYYNDGNIIKDKFIIEKSSVDKTFDDNTIKNNPSNLRNCI